MMTGALVVFDYNASAPNPSGSSEVKSPTYINFEWGGISVFNIVPILLGLHSSKQTEVKP